MSLKLFEEKRGRLTAACVAGFLGAEEDEVIVGTRTGRETCWEVWRYSIKWGGLVGVWGEGRGWRRRF